jgi:hypothetical protein
MDRNGDGIPDRMIGGGVDLNGDGLPDPRVTMPGAVRNFVDMDGDGIPDRFAGASVDLDGDGVPDGPDSYGADTGPGGILGSSAADVGQGDRYPVDADGDGYPDPTSGLAATQQPAPAPAPADDVPDYDTLVTTSAPAADPGYDVPDDPTFPADPAPAPAPETDFQQSIDDANQVEQSMDDVFDGQEGLA